VIDMIVNSPPDAGDLAILDGDIHSAPIGAQDAGGLDPAIDILFGEALLEMGIPALRPHVTWCERGSPTPNLVDPSRVLGHAHARANTRTPCP
jgi:hypothetical protein